MTDEPTSLDPEGVGGEVADEGNVPSTQAQLQAIQLELFRQSNEGVHNNFDEFRKTLLTLVSGSVGLSVGLLGFGSVDPGHSWWSLWTSWSFAGLSIVTILLSYHVAYVVYGSISLLMQLALTGVLEEERVKVHGRIMRYNLLSRIVNWIGGLSFVASIAFLMVFISLSVREGKKPASPVDAIDQHPLGAQQTVPTP
jgi:hypothetical protein